MTPNYIACPRCGQDWLYLVKLVHLDDLAVLCPECDALWHSDLPHLEAFRDYGTYMREQGRQDPERLEEIQFVGRLTSDLPKPLRR